MLSVFSYLCMLSAQFIQNIGGIKAGIVTKLSGDDLQGLGIRSNEQLLFSRNGPGVIPQVFGQLHLYGSSTCYNGVILGMGKVQLVYYQICFCSFSEYKSHS